MDLIIHGWIVRKRVHGGIVFLDLRTLEYPGEIIQAVFKEDIIGKEKLEEISKLPLETSIIIRGEKVRNPRLKIGFEILAKDYKITQKPLEEFPLGPKEHGVEAIMKYKHLSIRLPRYVKVWLIKEKVLKYFREWFEKNGWHEVTPPILVSSACEETTTLFEVGWFGNKAYLSQSAQLYLEAMIFSLGKVWSLTPSFRAEKSRTRRHLCEYWHLEWEAAWMGFEKLMKMIDEFVSYCIRRLLEDREARKIIEEFRGKDIKILELATETPYERVSYDEAIEILQKKGLDVKWGDDLGADEERELTLEFEKPIHLHHFPRIIKAFYMKVDRNRPETVLGTDLLLPEGYGEVIGAGEREDDYEILLQKIKEFGLNPKDYQWYLDLRKYGSVPHSGGGLGVERFVMWILKLPHIRETQPFPRLARDKRFI